MSESDKDNLIIVDPPDCCETAITGYPVALCSGQRIVRGGKTVAVVEEMRVIHSETDMLRYIAAQNKPKPDVSPSIDPADAEIGIRVDTDGVVWMGFFAADGRSALLNLNAIAEKHTGVISGALAAWCEDRRKQTAENRA